MLVDARTIPAGETVETDVCVVGAGPAGLVVALELAQAGRSVALLAGSEAGLGGEVAGEEYPPLEATRAGGLGGTAALWDAELEAGSFGARYAPLSPIDFENRGDWARGGWPFGQESLDAHYARAQEICEAGPFDYRADTAPFPVADADVEAGLFRFGTARAFTETQRRRVEASDRIRVLTEATATRIEADPAATVTSLEAASTPERRFSVAARVYVLAAGGLENPRLLLLSKLGDPELVGGGFMDHPTLRGRLEPTRRELDLGFFDVQTRSGQLVLGAAGLTAETMRREALLNGAFFLAPALDREHRATSAARQLVEAARRRQAPPEPLNLLGQAAGGIDALAYRAHRRLVDRRPILRPSLRAWPRARRLDTLGVGAVTGWSRQRRRPSAYDVHHVIEQTPDPGRRVSLSTERDRFGLPLARLEWFVGDRELGSARRAEEILGRALERTGIGRLTFDPVSPPHPSAHHHLGTTRMHSDPRHGVVDPDGRVHGVANLFVTGGSVFPTSGFVNPTLTIVALALRLAARLREDRTS